MNKTNYNLADIFKLTFAVLIMFAHTAATFVTFPSYIEIFFSLYIFAVPFFFACSAFFFFKNLFVSDKIIDEGNQKYKKFSKRILTMYLLWSLIYFSFVIFDWVVNGVTRSEVISYFHKSLVFSTYSTIWFLPALWIGVSITYFLLKRYTIKTVLLFAILLYIIGSIVYSYSPIVSGFQSINYLIDNYSKMFITTRNGFFNGFPLVVIGALVARNFEKKSIPFWICITFFVGVISESFFIKYYIKGFGVDFGLLLVPFTYLFLSWMLKVKLPDSSFFIKARNYSMLIFLSQRIFISAIPKILPEAILLKITQNPYIGLCYVCLCTFLLSYLIIKYRNKYTWLQKLS